MVCNARRVVGRGLTSHICEGGGFYKLFGGGAGTFNGEIWAR